MKGIIYFIDKNGQHHYKEIVGENTPDIYRALILISSGKILSLHIFQVND